MSGRLIALAVGALVTAGLVAVAMVLLVPRVGSPCCGIPDEPPAPAPRWVRPVAPPPRSASADAGIAGLVEAAWLDAVSESTGIPRRALAAYAGAAIVKAEAMPECVLSWTTLAAVGAVESDHGRHGGAHVQPDGTVAPPIYGVRLDGGDTAQIPDSDGGAIDKDATIDRAVGPMQFIPQAWRNWHVDGSGDGIEDPHNIDDAALAASNYLCRASSPQDTEAGWRAAIASYNRAPAYLDSVARHAEAYARAVR